MIDPNYYLDEETKLKLSYLDKTTNKIKFIFYTFVSIDIILLLYLIGCVYITISNNWEN